MNIAIIGGRDFNNYNLLKESIFKEINLNEISLIVSGGAKGADSLGERLGEEFGISTLVFKPDWSKHGRGAGFVRNKQIIENSDIVFAFWDGKSKGTKHSIDISNSLNKKIFIIKY